MAVRALFPIEKVDGRFGRNRVPPDATRSHQDCAYQEEDQEMCSVHLGTGGAPNMFLLPIHTNTEKPPHPAGEYRERPAYVYTCAAIGHPVLKTRTT